MLTEHTRLRVENQALTLRVRALEQDLARNSERVSKAKAKLDALIAQLPLEAPQPDAETAPQESLL